VDFNNSRYTNDTAYIASREQVGFVNRVYLWMCGALALTGVVAYGLSAPLEEAIRNHTFNPNWLFGAVIAEFVLVLVLAGAINKLSAMAATVMFAIYSVLNGVSLSLIFMVYSASSVAGTFFICAATFGAMSVYGYTTRRDLTQLGGILTMALLGLVIATIVNLFLKSSGMELILNYVGVLVFVGLTAYDTQKIRNLACGIRTAGMDENAEPMKKMALIGALTLYLDFINLFLYLLRLFGQRRSE